MLYLDPAALKALKRYALDQNTKVHSLLLDAVETWFKSYGLRQPVRVQTARQQSQGGETLREKGREGPSPASADKH